MSLTATVTPGKTFVAAELVTNSKLNQLAAPSVSIAGTADTGQITNNSVTAVKAAYGPWFYCVDGGTANAHSLTAATSATTLPTTLVTGQEFAYTANTTNTGAVTVAISGIGGTVALTKNGTTALGAGDVRSGQLVWVRYDGTRMQLATPNGQPRLDRFATTATSATAYTAIFSPTLTALTNGTRVLVKWHATNTSTATFAPDGLTAKAITKAADTALAAGDVVLNQISELVYDSTLDHWLLTGPVTTNTRTTVPVRQCVLSCSGDPVTGLPNYMVASTTTAIGFQNCDSTSLVMAFAYGFDTAGAVDYVAVVSANTSSVWTGLNGVSTTYYLYADRDISTGAITYNKTTTRPIYTNVPGTGNNTYLIQQSKMVNGSSTAIQRLFLGEVATSAGSVISTITPYMPRGNYVSPETALPATAVNTTVTLTHQLGLQPVQLRWVMRCLTGNLGYVAGDEVELWTSSFSDQTGRVWFTPVSTVTSLVCVLPWTTMTLLPYLWNKTTYAAPAAITPGSWRFVAYASRGW
jgi:hypothetical protein